MAPKVPSIPVPTTDPTMLYHSVMALKQVIDTLLHSKGSAVEIFGISTGIPEAPMDGKMYARKDGQWVEVPP